MTAGVTCSASATGTFTYRLHLQQKVGDSWQNRGEVGKVTVTPGEVKTVTASYTCGTTTYQFKWRTSGQWYKNGLATGLTVPSDAVEIYCS